jgi:hypothetical protein
MNKLRDQFVEKCIQNTIFSEQDFLDSVTDEYFKDSYSQKEGMVGTLELLHNPLPNLCLDHFKEFYFGSKDSAPCFSITSQSVGICNPGIYEIVGDSESGKSVLVRKLINEAPGSQSVFLVNNTLNVTSYSHTSVQRKRITSFRKLNLYFCFLYEELASKKLQFPFIFVDDFSAIAYEMDNLNISSLLFNEFIKICRKIRDEFLGVVVMTSLPKKSHVHNSCIGGICPSPWRNTPDKTLYVKMVDGQLMVETIENFTLEKQTAYIDFTGRSQKIDQE